MWNVLKTLIRPKGGKVNFGNKDDSLKNSRLFLAVCHHLCQSWWLWRDDLNFHFILIGQKTPKRKEEMKAFSSFFH